MADEILNCDGTDTVHKLDWSNIIGDKTLNDSGYFGDLLDVSIIHLEESMNKGQLKEAEVGIALGAAINESMKESIKFEIGENKTQLELCFLQAQIDKLRADIVNDECLAKAECALKAAQTLKVEEETILVSEKVKSEIKHNEDDGIYDQQVYKMQEDVLIAKEEVKIAISKENREYVDMISNIDKVMGYDYTLDSDGYIERGSLIDAGDGKMDAEVENIFANTAKTTYETSDLLPAQTGKVIEETALVTEKIQSEDKNNEIDGMIDQQINEMIAKVEIAKTQVALDQANSIAEIDKVMGYNYSLDGDGNIIVGSNAGDGKMDAEVEKIFAEKDLIVEQDNEIPLESARRDCTTTSQCAVNDAQVTKLECDCTNDTTMTDSKVSLNAAQENKLACDCCNDSKRTEAQIVKWECDCDNATDLKDADVALKGSQEILYGRQAQGFDDNANQKIYDSQLSAWSMVFADTELDTVTASIAENQLCHSYGRIMTRLDGPDIHGPDCFSVPPCSIVQDCNGDGKEDDGAPPPTGIWDTFADKSGVDIG